MRKSFEMHLGWRETRCQVSSLAWTLNKIVAKSLYLQASMSSLEEEIRLLLELRSLMASQWKS